MDENVLRYVRSVLERSRPHLLAIEKLIQETPNGIINFDLRVHDGKVKDMIVKSAIRIKF